MPILVCISRYRSSARTVEAGETIDVSEAEAAALRADAPGCWAEPEAGATEKGFDAPPVDKPIKRSVRK